jgi:hypothetical protein
MNLGFWESNLPRYPARCARSRRLPRSIQLSGPLNDPIEQPQPCLSPGDAILKRRVEGD